MHSCLQETYGEDPFLTGSFSQEYVRGLQGQHPRYVRANAGCKHFDVYAGPDNTRDTLDAKVGSSQENLDFLSVSFTLEVEFEFST